VPILTNPKHELFAQALAKGENATKAYQSAGFKGSRANASRLKANSNVAARVLELSVAGAKSAEVSVASLLAELEDARAKATSLNQLSAAVRATSEKAKISGLMTQKIEVEVNQPEYEPQTATEVLARILDRVGEKAARALADAFQIEYDERAIRALVNGSNGSQAPSQALEWRPPRADPKREI
jgi:hypothetical protein